MAGAKSPRSSAPVGAPTRGTTNPNRLRRVDRWLVDNAEISSLLRRAIDPLVVDLGYGASPITTVEMAQRLRTKHPEIRVLGLELDAERVAVAQHAADPPWLEFRRGGFELAHSKPVLVRAFNVLRQYDESEVRDAWNLITDRLAPGGLLVEGTCDEIGRLCSWVSIDHHGPRSLTISVKTSTLDKPSIAAERLPKILIHRNIPGERIHELLSTMDICWDIAAPHQTFGARVRWIEMTKMLIKRGWPVLGTARRWRLGELTLDYAAVASR